MKTAVLACLLFAGSARGQSGYPEVSTLRWENGAVICSPSRAQMLAVKNGPRPMTGDMAIMVLKLQFEAVSAYSIYLRKNESLIREHLTKSKKFIGPAQPIPEPSRLATIGACLISADGRLQYLALMETRERVSRLKGITLGVTIASLVGLTEPVIAPDDAEPIIEQPPVLALPVIDWEMRLLTKPR